MTLKKLRTTPKEKEPRCRDCIAAPIFCNAKMELALIASAIRTGVSGSRTVYSARAGSRFWTTPIRGMALYQGTASAAPKKRKKAIEV